MKKRIKNAMLIIGSGVVGFICGLFGGGGGMLVVPLLQKKGLDEKKAHATAMAVILPTTIASAVTYLLGGYFSLSVTLWTAGGCIAGGVIGALLLKKLPQKTVALIFAIIMVVAGIKLLFF